MNNSPHSRIGRRWALMAGALGLALTVSAARAQDIHDKGVPGTEDQNGASVVVRPPPAPPSQIPGIPPDKAAAFDAQAAKDDAARSYRDSVPSVNTSTLDMANSYPGLRTILPDDSAPTPPLN